MDSAGSEDDRAFLTERDDDLPNPEAPERGRVRGESQRPDFVAREMEHVKRPEQARVTVGFVAHRTGVARTNETLTVEGQAPPAGEPDDGLGREIPTPESAKVHPVSPSQRLSQPARDILGLPWICEHFDNELPRTPIPIPEPECGSYRLRAPDDRKPGRTQGGHERGVVGAAPSHDERRLPESGECSGRIQRRSARTRRPRIDEIQRRMADDGEHGVRDCTAARRTGGFETRG
jgi:hypothetical protein